MQYDKISLDHATGFFSRFFLDYVRQADALKPFYHRPPQLASFTEQLAEKNASFSAAARDRLANALHEQYKGLDIPPAAKAQLHALKNSSAFTVTTGHQLNILTGPLYVIYKIASTINLCRQLQAAYPQYTFIPMYWMASEDHDFEEIRSVRVRGKNYAWSPPPASGAVGELNPQSLKELLKEIPGAKLFEKAYLKHDRLSDAVRDYMNALFGPEGLLIVDGNCRELKGAFREAMQDDLFERIPQRCVEEQNDALIKRGYEPQIHVRPVNFFHLAPRSRSLIQPTEEGFASSDGAAVWSRADMEELIAKTPEQLSPNVALRPLYQECILPNLAYIGGAAEIVYWLQLKRLFDRYRVPFPILVPRSFVLIMDGPINRKWEKMGLALPDLTRSAQELHTQWVVERSAEDLTMDTERNALGSLFESAALRAGRIDPTLTASVKAEGNGLMKRLAHIEKKLLRAERRKHADALQQIEAVKEALFPGGALQERVDNFLNFYLHDPEFIQKMIALCDPLDMRLNLARYPYEKT